MKDSADRNLSFWKKGLGVVPTWVWERTELETLVLADNGLSDLSDRIGGLKKLRMLDLGHNKLARLPAALGDLSDLTDFLYLHDNRLTALPRSLRHLAKLRYLNLSDNAFETIPEAVTHMESLIELRVTDNRLASIPDSLGRLSRLRELHLRNNRIMSLPDSIGLLSELRQLDLRGNPLELPASVAALPRLDKLDLRWVETLAPNHGSRTSRHAAAPSTARQPRRSSPPLRSLARSDCRLSLRSGASAAARRFTAGFHVSDCSTGRSPGVDPLENAGGVLANAALFAV